MRWRLRGTHLLAVGPALALGLALLSSPLGVRRGAELPSRLADQEFWQLSAGASEPGGYFRSQDITNLTSNELWFQVVIPDLVKLAPQGGVYLGVGPEQNYTYMAALRPKLAIVFDIRRGNFDIQLMYKAIFELAKDRADFVSMVFSRPRPPGVGVATSAQRLFAAFSTSTPSDTLFKQNMAAIEDRLVKVHGFPLDDRDLSAIRTIYQTFFYSGFAVRASPTYADLMTATDESGIARSFLASEQSFTFLKDLEARNLVVPVVGDFGGPKAIRAIGAYLRKQNAVVSAFYLSNVEQYLYQDGKWDTFCRNVATLPLDDSSTFIRATSGFGGFGRGGSFITSLGGMLDEVKACRRL